MKSEIVSAPHVLLPRCDFQKWAVVACDQFSSDRGYWQNIEAFVGDAPSTLNLILPEAYINDPSADARLSSAIKTMRTYYESGLFYETDGFLSVTRTFASGVTRKGLIAAVDLEAYDYTAGTHASVRATEGTVLARIPPRVAIRSKSLLELPHILLLIDDPQNLVFSAVEKGEGETLYDFELNGNGGHIVGKHVQNERVVKDAFAALSMQMKGRFKEDVLLLVGDGNHSLAAAKDCYEQAKAAGEPAEKLRYALCEIVNLYDRGVPFLPIHRAVFGVDVERFIAALQKAGGAYSAVAVGKHARGTFSYGAPHGSVETVAFVQAFCERYVAQNGGEIDYIHGDEALEKLARQENCVALSMPCVPKSGFTEYIIQHGALPKKSFSMGEAEEKRYYLEARIIHEP